MKAKISIAVRILVSIGMIAFLVWSMRDNFSHIASTLGRVDILKFAIAVFTFMTVNIWLMSLRLRLLLAGEGLTIPLGKVFQLTYIGFFFNNFMPTAVGGDIVKAFYVHKQTQKTKEAFIAVFMDRFIGLFSFILIAVIALLISWQNIDVLLRKAILLMALCAFCGALVAINSTVAGFILRLLSKLKLLNLGERISKVYRAVHEYRNKKTVVLGVAGISIVAQCIYFVVVYLLVRSLTPDISLLPVFMIMPIVSVVSMLPSLGGLGLREGAIVALFGPIVGQDTAFSASILLLAMLLIISLVGSLIYLLASQFKIKKTEIESFDTYNV